MMNNINEFSTNVYTSIQIEDDLNFMEYRREEDEETDEFFEKAKQIYEGVEETDYVSEEADQMYDDIQETTDVLKDSCRNDIESCDSNQYWYSPSGSGNEYCIPNVPDNIKPKVGSIFQSISEVDGMYFHYAPEAGFDVRKYTSQVSKGVMVLRYLVCNRQGKPNTSPLDTLDPSKSRTKRVDMHRRECMAGIKCKITPEGDGYMITDVEEMHNHRLFSKQQMCMSKAQRKLHFYQRSFMYRMLNVNVGPSVSQRLYCELQGGVHYAYGSKDDFKNCMRDLNCHIGGNDAQMLVNKLTKRKKHCENFTFIFREEKEMLNAFFWADDTAKMHYTEFGDLVSFDATFRTNRYDMVFVPFTGIDNHTRCVTFGAAMLSREDADSYIWLLKTFRETFVRKPRLILSDQCPAMKIAVEEVFPDVRHRLCMWHITSKLSNKVSTEIFNSDGFKKTFNSLVWNSRIESNQFEEGWDQFIDDYGLSDNNWFTTMFELRHDWIPAYFHDIPLCGLMRTTSRSESENRAFQQSVNPGTSLNNFMTAFELQMERQRFNQGKRDFNDAQKYPLRKTVLIIEEKAYKFYTRAMFLLVQKELYHSIYSCTQFNFTQYDHIEEWFVREKTNKSERNDKRVIKKPEEDEDPTEWDDNLNQRDFKVQVNKDEQIYSCSCLMLEQRGILCRHIFCLMKWHGFNDIPEKYLLRRWRQDLIPLEKLRRSFRYGDMDETVDILAIDLFSSIDYCLKNLHTDKPKLAEYVKCVKELQEKFLSSCTLEPVTEKTTEYDALLGVTTPDVVNIHNPSGIRNKGKPKRTRMKGLQEVATKKKSKSLRTCTCCGKPAHHDAKNCPEKNKPSTSSKRKK